MSEHPDREPQDSADPGVQDSPSAGSVPETPPAPGITISSEEPVTHGPFLFEDLTVVPPLEEFRRLFNKKLRAFESGETAGEVEPYRAAFRMGEEKILRQLGEEESC